MRKLNTPAPTNESGTCILCGAKLVWYRSETLPREAATPEQAKDWPIVHVYSGTKARGLTQWSQYGGLEDMRYEGSYYAETALAIRPEHGRGLRIGPSWRRSQGDNLFCSTHCAVGFARIAANMGFRLPSLTPKERRAWRRHMRFLQELAPFELEPPEVERTEHPTGPRTPRKWERTSHRYIERDAAGTRTKSVTFDPSIPAPPPEELNASRSRRHS